MHVCNNIDDIDNYIKWVTLYIVYNDTNIGNNIKLGYTIIINHDIVSHY